MSVIMPVHNAGKYLPECLETLVKQSYLDIEIIVINDNSKDNSLKILKEFKKRHKNIRIMNNKKRYGPAVCLNRAMRVARGQFLAFMNSSDTISPHRFKKQVRHLNLNSKIVAVGSQFVTIDDRKRLLLKSSLPEDHDDIYQTLIPSISLKPESVMINRMLLPKDIIRFSTNKYPLLYTEVMIKLLQYGKIANLNQVLYRQRAGVKPNRQKRSKIKQTVSLLQLMLKSRASYDYRPSLRLSLPAMFRNF